MIYTYLNRLLEDNIMKSNTISQVVKNDLCTGCGTCHSLCPQEAIELIIDNKKGIYIPKINEKNCNKCDLCFKVCPGYETDYDKLNLKTFTKQPENYLIGNFLNCFIGHSNDKSIRYNSSSGGLITQLLIFALEERIIDGALVTRMKKNNPLEPESFIARSRDEIIEASKSKYCPVPTNIALKEILESGSNEKFAVVGLPCHINGIRKAELLNKQLKNKIVLIFGLFCSHTDTFKGTEYVYNKLNINKVDISKISYRGLGWPGSVEIKLKSGRNIKVPLGSTLWKNYHNSCLFTPNRCLMCNDLTAEFSDISFGDPWLPEIIEQENKGKTILISRSNNGERLLNLAVKKEYIKLSSISCTEVIKSQKLYFNIKKVNIIDRIKFMKLLGKNSPNFPKFKSKISFYNKFFAIFLLTSSYCGSKFPIILNYIPIKILNMQQTLFYLLYSLVNRDDFNEK